MSNINEDTTKFCINSGINYFLMECDKYTPFPKKDKCMYYTFIVNSTDCQDVYNRINSAKKVK